MQGRTEIDGLIAIVLFVIFVAWALTFYNTIFETEDDFLSSVAGDVNDVVLNFLEVDVTEVPIKVEVENSSNNTDLILNFIWPSDTINSAKILDNDGNEIPCAASGNSLQWQANVTNTSPNYFTMRFSTQNMTLNCDVVFPPSNVTRTTPFAEEMRKMISQAKIINMTNTSYETFKSEQEINRDFQVELNISGNITTYGLAPPPASDVVARKTLNVIEETNADVEVIVLVF